MNPAPSPSDDHHCRAGEALLPAAGHVGYCLVDPVLGQVTMMDARLRDWYGADGPCPLHDLLPDVSIAENSPSPVAATQAAVLRTSQRQQMEVMVTVRRLDGPSGGLLLLAIHPLAGGAQHTAYRDALTGLPDRRQLTPQRELWRAKHGTDRVPYALLFLDLDEFKQVNDQWGHAVGDDVLLTLARRWRQCLRGGDLLVRYGGDEFVALVAGVRARQDAQMIIARLQKATAEPVPIDGQSVSLRVSIGVALATDLAASLGELITTADADMYQAKRAKS